MQYQLFELTPRGVLAGLEVTGTGALNVSVSPGVFCLGFPELYEKVAATALAVADNAVTAIYANPDGSISLTPEADKAPGYVRFGAVDKADDHQKGRSLKIAEVTAAAGAVTVISIKCRFEFDGQRTNFRGLHNESTNAPSNW